MDQPSAAGLEAEGVGEIEDAVVAFVPVFERFTHLRFGGAGGETHEGIGEVIAGVIVLRREVITLRLALLPDQCGLGLALVHVVGNGAHVVEKLGVDRPFVVFGIDGVADDFPAEFVDDLLQLKTFAVVNDVAEAFIGRAVIVGADGGGTEPAFIDPAAMEAEGVEVFGVELEAFAGLEEGAGHPAGGESQQAVTGFKRGLGGFPDVAGEGLQFFH